MNTTHIKSFLYVSKYNSISKAADKLNYSTSTIYEHLKSLENEVGVTLYNKANRGIYLTENGEIFLEYANKILDIVDDIHRRFYKSSETLRITASESSGFFVMKPLMDKFIIKYPDIEIDYTKATTDVAIEKILNGLCDVGVISEPGFSTSEVKCDFLCKLPLSFVAYPKHICFKNGIVDSREDNTLLSTMGFTVVSNLLVSKGLLFSDYFSSKKNIGDLQTLKELAYEGIGISLLPTFLVEDDIAQGKLKLIPEFNEEFSSRIYILTELNNKKVNKSVNNFVQLAHSLLANYIT